MSEEKILPKVNFAETKVYFSKDTKNFEELFLDGTVHFVPTPMMYDNRLPELSLRQKRNLLSNHLAKFKLDSSQPTPFFVVPQNGALYKEETRLFLVFKGDYIVLSENKISIMSGDDFRALYDMVSREKLVKSAQNLPGAGQRSL